MNILTTAQALEAINRRLQRPITRQLFHQSIIPLMLERGDAQKVGASIIVNGQWVGAWAEYIAWRETQIAAGKLPPKHPYSIDEMEELHHGIIDPESVELWESGGIDTSSAATHLRRYLAAHRRELTGPQRRALSTTARQAPAGCTIGELAEMLRQEPCPIFGLGPVTAEYILGIL